MAAVEEAPHADGVTKARGTSTTPSAKSGEPDFVAKGNYMRSAMRNFHEKTNLTLEGLATSDPMAKIYEATEIKMKEKQISQLQKKLQRFREEQKGIEVTIKSTDRHDEHLVQRLDESECFSEVLILGQVKRRTFLSPQGSPARSSPARS